MPRAFRFIAIASVIAPSGKAQGQAPEELQLTLARLSLDLRVDYANRTERRYLERGATTADLSAAFRAADPRSERILSDWLFTTRWHARLGRSETLAQMIESYRQP